VAGWMFQWSEPLVQSHPQVAELLLRVLQHP
jgi:hypothetical protein